MRCFEEFETDNPNLKALDLILAAWDEGVDTGVQPQQMAYAALFTICANCAAPTKASIGATGCAN